MTDKQSTKKQRGGPLPLPRRSMLNRQDDRPSEMSELFRHQGKAARRRAPSLPKVIMRELPEEED